MMSFMVQAQLNEVIEETTPDENMENVEEDFIVDESEPIYPIVIKEENDYQSEEVLIFEECDYGYQNPQENKSEGQNFKLNVCYRSNEYQEFVSNHQRTEDNAHSLQVFEQNKEDENISQSENINRRMLQSNPVKLESTDIVCQSCERSFHTMYEVESHECKSPKILRDKIVFEEISEGIHRCQKKQQTSGLFSCPVCPKSFSLITMLQKHQNSHKPKSRRTTTQKANKEKNNEISGSDLSQCSICNTIFSSKKNLKLHSKMHVKTQMKTIEDAMPVGTNSCDKNKFFCEICNKSFNHSLLFVHQNMHQNIEEHNCSICNRQFENQVSYDMHMQLHADQPTRVKPQQGTKPGARFACNYCGKEFLRPHEKVKHERIHTGEKPHECEVCGKSFRVSYSLTLHLRTHTDIRPFVCAQCNKRFKSYAVYSHHLNTHSEDRPYKCPMCPKSFRTSVQLCGHKNSHTKPYNCPDCNRPFSSLYAVKMHMKTHNKANKSNENLKHRCDTCGAVYARMFALRFHMKEQHSADLPEEEETDTNNVSKSPALATDCVNEDEVSILSGEEIIIDNFQPEEIVTDWLTKK